MLLVTVLITHTNDYALVLTVVATAATTQLTYESYQY
jgi:hypothetical protein